MRCILSMASLLVLLAPVTAQDLVAKTDALSPADEQKAFKLPKGFEIQLIAAEPDIQKPMQMAFDTKGRLWVTTSHHYPWAAEAGKGTDRLYVLSDFDEKGKAKTIKIFDEKLNIPIGVLPLGDGKSVIVSEAGSILKLTDTDGDGKADKREVLYGGFGVKDTHGMTNSFTPMPDGWIYATHGFNNDSKVKGSDGHEIAMNSGHTFRFKADGSRIEIFTRGQVNPFGIAVDPWGNLYTACCHSKPITQLIRGSYYDHFGSKPHDGLGFGPHVVNHQHGSTGLCGLAWGAGPLFPKEWDGVMFLGNCVTNRINCDRIEWKGSTPVGKELPDFLSTTDAWFRPVDLRFGPDGALYVSDFYNKIIGHYEVDLKHPGRDNMKGRLWRIVWTGPKRAEKNFEADQLDEVKAMRKLSVEPKLSEEQRKSVIATLGGKPQAARAAVDAMTAQPDADFVKPLLAFIPKIPADDNHLRHAARIALRNSLVIPGAPEIDTDSLAQLNVLLDVNAGIPYPISKRYSSYVNYVGAPKELRMNAARMLGRFDQFGYWDDVAESTVEGRSGDAKTEANGLFKADMLAALFDGHLKGRASKADARTILINGNDSHRVGVIQGEIVAMLHSQYPAVVQRGQSLLAEWKKTNLVITGGRYNRFLPSESARAADAKLPLAERVRSLDILLWFDPENSKPTIRPYLLETKLEPSIRVRIAKALLTAPSSQDCGDATTALKTADYSLALALAEGLAGDGFGADLLLLALKKGEAPTRLLFEKAVLDKLKASKIRDIDARIAELTKGIPAPEKRIDDLIKKRGAGFPNFKADLNKGKEIFTKNCANCHQVNNEGAKVGPQLDGIGIRGLERLLEDTLDPSRNVDAAFKSTTLQLLDGRNPTGLVREDGAVYVLIDNLGKENRIAVKDVDKVVKSNLSAMPANVDAIIPESDYYHLLAYLLSQRPK